MLAGSVTRVVSSMLLAFLGKIHLPALLVILSLAIAAIGIALVAKSFWSQIRLPELVTYHVAADLGAAISFIVLHFYMVGYLFDRNLDYRFGFVDFGKCDCTVFDLPQKEICYHSSAETACVGTASSADSKRSSQIKGNGESENG